MIRPYIARLTGMLVTLIAVTLALSITAPSVAEAKRKPTRTPIPPPTATPAPVQLPAPTLLSPPNGSTVGLGPLTWRWSEVPGAACYSFEAGSSPDFDQVGPFLSQGCLTDTSFTINVDEAFVFYVPYLYWRVRARDANNVGGQWSEVWLVNFTNPSPEKSDPTPIPSPTAIPAPDFRLDYATYDYSAGLLGFVVEMY